MSRMTTGYFFQSYRLFSILSPLKSSRRPSKMHFSVSSISDLPNRRGLEMKNRASSESDTSRQSMSVLSTYVYLLTNRSKEQNDVAIFSMPLIIP